MHHRPNQHRARAGSALLLALISVLTIAGLSLAFLSMSLSTNAESAQDRDTARARLLAEVGILEGLIWAREGGSGEIGTQAAPARYGDGILWVESTLLPSGSLRLASHSMVGRGRVSLRAVVTLDPGELSLRGVLSNKELVFGPRAFSDSYDSALGEYATQVDALTGVAGDEIQIQSNGDVTTGSNAELHGDVNPGTEGCLNLGPGSTVDGSTSSLARPFELEEVVTPSIPSSGAYNVVGAHVLAPGDYHFSTFTMGNHSTLRIDGPARVVIDGDVDLTQVTLELGLNGQPVEIYIAGDVTTLPHTVILTDQDDGSLVSLFLTGGEGQTAEFMANSAFRGFIYGAHAAIEVGPHFEIFGAIAADEITLGNDAKVHFDRALANIQIGTPELVAASWRSGAFPVPAWARSGRDPIQLLGLDREALLSPAAARR